MVFQEES